MAENLLSPGEVDIIETAKEELKPMTFGRQLKKSVKKSFFSKSKPAGRNPFGRRPEPEDFTKEQNILRGMFGGGGKVMTNFDGRSLPRIDNTLNSGGGLLKSGDRNRETAGIFGF